MNTKINLILKKVGKIIFLVNKSFIADRSVVGWNCRRQNEQRQNNEVWSVAVKTKPKNKALGCRMGGEYRPTCYLSTEYGIRDRR